MARCARRDGVGAAAVAAGALGEPMASLPPVGLAKGVRDSLGGFGFETD